MELSFWQQSAAFFWSLALGGALSVFYGMLKFLRFCFSFGKAMTFVCDVIFMLTSAVVLFLFSLGFLHGAVRVYVLIGSSAGFFALRLTAGRLAFRVYRPVVCLCGKYRNKIFAKCKLFAKKLLKKGLGLLYNVGVKKSENHNLDDRGNEYGIETQKAEHKKGSGHRRFKAGRSSGGQARQEA